MRPDNERRALAELRVQKALHQIEAAQQLLGHAMEDLCSIEGMLPEWEALGRLYRSVKSQWHRVSRKREVLRKKHGPLVAGAALPDTDAPGQGA